VAKLTMPLHYVDMFEEEEPIDLDVVATEISDLETEMQKIDAELSDFCTQLNIKAPF
jgi:type I restriction enzyme M protein